MYLKVILKFPLISDTSPLSSLAVGQLLFLVTPAKKNEFLW